MKDLNNVSYTSPHILASLPNDTPVLLAYSGGADSSALLHLLYEDSMATGYTLHAAHFNHKIRKDEAERDAELCQRTCEKLNIPFHLGAADIPSLAKANGNSIESEARDKRYAFFEKIMCENGIPILVTAHHSEDQIESIMLHLLRGSSIKGLCGMQECRPLSDGLYLVRPILHSEKEDILSFCAKNNIEFVNDSTNTDTSYARNFIRAEITPKMRVIQPNITAIFERLANSASETNDYIDSVAKEFLDNECKNGNISLSKFNSLHPAIKSRVLCISFEQHSNGAMLEGTHVKSVIELCEKAEPHASISLPKRIAAKIENESLVFGDDKTSFESEDFRVPFSLGKTQLPNGIVINIEKNPECDPTETDVFLNVKCDMIKNDAHFRSKKEGDVIFSGKMNKKVKKIISEKKIALELRNKLPILVCENEILWIPTVAACDCVKREKINLGDNFYRITINFEN